MRDNGNRDPFGLGAGSGVVRPVDWTPTHYQIKPHEGYAPEVLRTRGEDSPGNAQAPATKLLAVPPSWTHRDDLPCVKRVPRGNEKDPYDTTDRKAARALCAGCPVKQECLTDALREEEGLGPRSRNLVRGGLTPSERYVQALSNSPYRPSS